MPNSHVPTLEDRDFEAEVLRSPLPVLLEFTAEWCGPCRALEPIIDNVAEQMRGRVRVFRVDADASPALATRYRVRGVPTVVTVVGGEEHRRHIGLTSAAKLLQLLP